MKVKRVVYRFWHDQSAKGRVGYIGKDKYHPRRYDLTRRAQDAVCRKLYRALKKYPPRIWHREIVASGFRTDAALAKAEMFHIARFDSRHKGYNCTDGGEGAAGWKRSVPFSAEHRAKLSEAHKGNKPSAETRLKMSKAQQKRHLTMPHSIETRAKISKGNKGKTISAETRAKVSKGLKKWYAIHPHHARAKSAFAR